MIMALASCKHNSCCIGSPNHGVRVLIFKYPASTLLSFFYFEMFGQCLCFIFCFLVSNMFGL